MFDKAQEMYEAVVEGKEELYGKENIDMISSLQNLGFVLEENKEYDKAKIIYEKIFALLKKHHLKDVLENAKLLFHYSTVLMHLNQLQMARAIYKKGFSMIEIRLEQTNSLYLNYLQNLSIVNMKMH